LAVTIIDIARDSNTSKSTVSRYLNGGSVKPATAQAIEASVKKLNYHPNVNARRLVTSKSHAIGVVLEDISNTYFSEVLAGIQSVVTNSGYVCTFYSRASNSSKESDYLSLFNGGHIDGLILGTFQKRIEQEVAKLAKMDYPIVLIGDNCGNKKIDCVDVDNEDGTLEEVEYLHSMGHRRIAYLRGPEMISGARTRAQGFIEGMHRHGLKADIIVDTEWTVEGGYAAAMQVLRHQDVTAIICSNEYCAYGAISACQESGRTVPDDISIVAFDDGTLARYSVPSITTVKQPFKSVGETAANHLVNLMKSGSQAKTRILLQSHLVIRSSSGAAPAGPR